MKNMIFYHGYGVIKNLVILLQNNCLIIIKNQNFHRLDISLINQDQVMVVQLMERLSLLKIKIQKLILGQYHFNTFLSQELMICIQVQTNKFHLKRIINFFIPLFFPAENEHLFLLYSDFVSF